jgi:hypothetical protein
MTHVHEVSLSPHAPWDNTGAGWACLTPWGATRRDTQLAALVEIPAAARDHRAGTRASQPTWFIPTRSP